MHSWPAVQVDRGFIIQAPPAASSCSYRLDHFRSGAEAVLQRLPPLMSLHPPQVINQQMHVGVWGDAAVGAQFRFQLQSPLASQIQARDRLAKDVAIVLSVVGKVSAERLLRFDPALERTREY